MILSPTLADPLVSQPSITFTIAYPKSKNTIAITAVLDSIIIKGMEYNPLTANLEDYVLRVDRIQHNAIAVAAVTAIATVIIFAQAFSSLPSVTIASDDEKPLELGETKPRGAHFCTFTTPREGNPNPSTHDELIAYLKSEFVKGLENFWTDELAEGNGNSESQLSFMRLFPNLDNNEQMIIYGSMIDKFQQDFIKKRDTYSPPEIFSLKTKKDIKVAIQNDVFIDLFGRCSILCIEKLKPEIREQWLNEWATQPDISSTPKIKDLIKDKTKIRKLQLDLATQDISFHEKLDARLKKGKRVQETVKGAKKDTLETFAITIESFFTKWEKFKEALLEKYPLFKDKEVEIFVTELVTVLAITPENYTNLRRIRINELTSKVEQCFLTHLQQYQIHLSRRLALTFTCQHTFITKLLVIHENHSERSSEITEYVVQKITKQCKIDSASDSAKKPLYRYMQGKHERDSASECRVVTDMVKPLWELLFVNKSYAGLQDAHTALFPGAYSWDKEPDDLKSTIIDVAHKCLLDASETHHMFGIFNTVDGEIEAKLDKKYKHLLGDGLIAAYKEGLNQKSITLERVVFHNKLFLDKINKKANEAIENAVVLSTNSDQTLVNHIFKAIAAPILRDAVDRLQQNIA